MSHATESLQDAFAATKRLLFPVSLHRWLALAVAAFFVGGTTGFDVNYNVGTGTVDLPEPIVGPRGLFPQVASPEFVVVGAAVLVVGLLSWYLGALFEFVFVEQLRTTDAHLRGRIAPAARPGLSLFGFRLVVGLLAAGSALFVAILPAAFGNVGVLLLLVFLPGLFVVGIVLWLANRLTTDFVVPVMIATDDGLVDAWRAFWPDLRGELREYGLYLLVRVVLGLIAGVVLAVGYLAIAIVVGIPLLLLFLLSGFVLFEVLAVRVVELLAVGFLLVGVLVVVIVGTVLVAVPVRTYLRYYALFVLGGVTPEYDLVEGIREDIQGGTEDRAETGT
ncbi:hypothetical protein AArcSl_1826 [Halalkaliarchaeum desulfuricum]|uniref:Uncharacterized protein n=1 Tax=Halalkaliarchaeum desulfuricum TaxID=2055893 RepID=A0A343TK30_9EURY|nr:hypothetical protein [Halalkaliarchaeum desulfuricum]AUX09452.1 hypothetical protein AArcSl_1826 [Halalkaliarchaeum desulfuricum]